MSAFRAKPTILFAFFTLSLYLQGEKQEKVSVPNQNKNTFRKTQKTLQILYKFDCKKEDNADWNIIKGNIFKSLVQNKEINLIIFTCSNIEAKYLYSKTNFSKYVSTNPNGNNLENDISKLTEILKSFKKQSIPVVVTVLIGDTDPYYIETQELAKLKNKTKDIYMKTLDIRWNIYRQNFDEWIRNKINKAFNVRVLSWYRLQTDFQNKTCSNYDELFSKVYSKKDSYFTNEDVEFGFRILKKFFPTYYKGLNCPSDSILRDWVSRQFCEYSVQGYWIKEIWPEGIFILNERPTDLKYKMYQPLIKQILDSRLPCIYPFVVDNLGYS